MDELEIAGQRYLSTRRAGKEHKYHSDYIGQLIRGGKVIGKKVGRSWYVQEDSLNAYLSGEVFDTKAASKKEVAPVLKVEPVAAKEVPVVQPAPAVTAVAEVVEEKITVPNEKEIVADAAPAPIKIVKEPVALNTTPVRRIPIDDANRVQINGSKVVSVKSNNLRYISDDAPVLPEVPSKKIAVTVSEEVPTYEAEYLPSVEEVEVQSRSSRAGVLSLAALAVIGILTFSITAGASVAISSHTVVEEGQVAGAGYTLK